MTADGWTSEQTAKLREYRAQGWGDIRCAAALGKSKDNVRHKWERMAREARQLPAVISSSIACTSYAYAQRISACWRQSVGAIIQVGVLLNEAKERLPHGEFGPMIETQLPFTASTAQRLMAVADDPRLTNPALAQHLPASWYTLYELTKVDNAVFSEKLADRTICPDMERADAVALIRPHGSRAVAPSRREPDDSLDFFPTPPWATRALLQRVFPVLSIGTTHCRSVWEPACGEGHMSEVLREGFPHIYATDIHDYGTSYQDRLYDFLGDDYAPSVKPGRYDWIITNPPFGDNAAEFVLRALDYARYGVAMFVRSQWAVEGIGRYESLFRDRPPNLFCPFVERVNLCKGRWEPDGSTLTSYSWLVWCPSGAEYERVFRIPPGCREALTRPDDRERFMKESPPPTATNGSTSSAHSEARSLVAQSVGGGEHG